MRSAIARRLVSLGASCAERPWRVIGVWVVVIAVAVGLAAAFGARPSAGVDDPANTGAAHTGADARVIVQRSSGVFASGDLDALRARLLEVPAAASVSAPRLAARGDTALITVRYRLGAGEIGGSRGRNELERAVAPFRGDGVRIEIGGEVPEQHTDDGPATEKLAVLVALGLLCAILGSPAAVAVCATVALFGIGTGLALLTMLGGALPLATVAPYVSVLIGVVISADYVLLFLAQFREALQGGLHPRAAAAEANGRAGGSVVIAGLTVTVCLPLGSQLLSAPTLSTVSYAVAAVVVGIVAVVVTVVPAMCGAFGHRVARQAATARRPRKRTRSVATVASTVLVLVLLAVPVTGLRTWPRSAGSWATTDTIRRAYDVTADAFGPGANGPFTVVVEASAWPVGPLVTALRRTGDFAFVSDPDYDARHSLRLFTVEARSAPDDAATVTALRRLRAALPDGATVTGLTAYFADLSTSLDRRFLLMMLAVVALAEAVVVAFTDPVGAATAGATKLLGLAATYGAMVVLFQWGWGTAILGLPAAVPMSTWAAVLAFVIVFASSTNHEVFTVSEARNSHVAAAGGLVAIAILLAFALDPDIVVRMLCIGAAVGILIDVFAVRLVLFPGVMTMVRAKGWTPN